MSQDATLVSSGIEIGNSYLNNVGEEGVFDGISRYLKSFTDFTIENKDWDVEFLKLKIFMVIFNYFIF